MSKEIILEAVWHVWSFRWRRKALKRRCVALRELLPAQPMDESRSGEPSPATEGTQP